MAKIIDGKAVSAAVKERVRDDIARDGLDIGLAVVIVGDDPASRVYVNNKKKACEFCGIKSYEYALPQDTTEAELLELIDTLNGDAKVNGILVQLPLPKQLDEKTIIEHISPVKDVDAFHESNVGRIMIGNYAFLPCTPAGCMELIHSTGVDVSGKECVGYIVSQLFGATVGAGLLYAFIYLGDGFNYGGTTAPDAYLATNVLQPGATAGMALLAEGLLTFFFVLVVLGATDANKGFGKFAGLAIGLALGLVNIVGIPVDNCSVNPARSFGPAVFCPAAWGDFWIMVVGPVIGAMLAVLCWVAMAGGRKAVK